VALVVPGRLRPRIFLIFSTTRVVIRQLNALAAFTPGEIPGAHLQRLSWPQGTWFCRKEPRKKSQVTPPGIDPGTIRLVAQCLNHYTTPGPLHSRYRLKNLRNRTNLIWTSTWTKDGNLQTKCSTSSMLGVCVCVRNMCESLSVKWPFKLAFVIKIL
jgi:hypothetical protein